MSKILCFFKKNLYQLIILLLLTVTAVKLISNLTVNPLFMDELFTLNILYSNDLYKIILYGNILDNHPPLYHLILFCFTQCFGVSEFIIRLPSVIFNIISIYLIFILAKKLFSPTHGFISAIVAIILMPNIYVSQNARGYSLLFLLSILTMISLVNIINYKLQQEDKNIPFNVLSFFIISSLMCVYTHYYGCILVFCELLFLFLFFHKNILREIIIIVICLTFFFGPWLLISFPKGLDLVNPNFINWMNWSLFNNYNLYILNFIIIIGIFFYILKIRKFSITTIKKEHYSFALILFLFIFPFVLISFIHYNIINCYHHRHMIISLAPFYILIANTFIVISKNKLILLILLFIFYLSAIKQTNNFIIYNNCEYYLKFMITNSNYTNRHILIIDKGETFWRYYKYHFDKYLLDKKNITYIEDYSKQNINEIIDTLSITNEYKYLWLLDSTSFCNMKQICDKTLIVISEMLPTIYLAK